MLGRGAALARTEFDRIILLYFSTPAAVAGYNIAARGAHQLNLFSSALHGAVAPTLTRAGPREITLQASTRQADGLYWFVGPLILCVLAASPAIMALPGAEYVQFVPIILALGLLEYLNIVFGPVEIHLRLLGSHRAEAMLVMLSSIIVVIGGILLAPAFSLYGVTFAAILGGLFFKATALATAVRRGIMHVPARRFLRLIPAAVLIGAFAFEAGFLGRTLLLLLVFVSLAVHDRDNVRALSSFLYVRLVAQR
jgi:O-antigen/teichoic acid export membrane protein